MPYAPGVTSTKIYRPASFVVTVRALCVATSVNTTLAPGTTAPDESVTAPATVPVDVDCAQTGAALLSQSTAEHRTKQANREVKICRWTRIAKPSKNEE